MNTIKQDPEEDDHGYDNLCKYSIEKCELCDMVFSSRFANIIHSSQHIIIPLIKQKIHTCKKCLYCFTSKSALKAHKEIKHKKKETDKDNDGQIGHEESQNGQEVRENGHERCEMGHQEDITDKLIVKYKKSATRTRKNHKIHDKSHNSHNESRSQHKESENSRNESQNEADTLLRSIITNQPIVKIDNIATIVAKTLLATKNDEKHSKPNKNINISEKDSPKNPKHKKTELKNHTKKVNKELTPEIIFSRPQTSQNNITKELSNKIIIGGKKRTSPDKTENDKSKKTKVSTITHTNEINNDKNTNPRITNGVNTANLTSEYTNRFSFSYREISPDVISIKSDSSDEPNGITLSTVDSKRRLFEFSHNDEEILDNQSKTQPKIALKDQPKAVPPIDQTKPAPLIDKSKESPQNQTKMVQTKPTINIPFVITDSDSELEANIDELLLLNNVTSPVKKSNFRSKIQFEDDENLLIDLERELSNLSYEFKSVHYDKLMEHELSECRRCHMIFMNRLALYKHETTHMRFRRTRKHYFCKYCENYYAGNHFSQKKHYEQIHNKSVDNNKVFPCPVCKLQYHKLKEHYKKNHPNLICKNCSTCFGTSKVFQTHNCAETNQINSLVDSKNTKINYEMLLVCELCLSFTKTTGNFKYEVVGEKCEVGERQRCFYCAKDFFEVKIVKRINFMTSIKSQNLKNGDVKKKIQGSNVKKLSMIRRRLKAMKK